MSEKTAPSLLQLEVIQDAENPWSVEHEKLIRHKTKVRIAFGLSLAGLLMGGIYAAPAIMLAVSGMRRATLRLSTVTIALAVLSLGLWISIFVYYHHSPAQRDHLKKTLLRLTTTPTTVTPPAAVRPQSPDPYQITADGLLYNDARAAEIGLKCIHHLALEHGDCGVSDKDRAQHLIAWYDGLAFGRSPIITSPDLTVSHLLLAMINQRDSSYFIWDRFKRDQNADTIIAWRPILESNRVVVLYGDGSTIIYWLDSFEDFLPYESLSSEWE